ncbi:MAG: hypothetical protein SPE43_10785 [Ruminococcus sp.]|nr:hypothetical protein [Ruminococcus sp.]
MLYGKIVLINLKHNFAVHFIIAVITAFLIPAVFSIYKYFKRFGILENKRRHYY